MSWKDDRDALIAQTMAFVQSVANRRESKPEIVAKLHVLSAIEAQDPPPPAPETARFAPIEVADLPPVVPVPAPRPHRPGEMANEIRARVAGFRAHQERFNREREEYSSTTLAKMRATLDEKPRPPSDK